jgi:PAS domain S-box-containing protein
MFTKEIYEKTEGQPSMAQLPIPIATFDTHFRFLSYSDVWLKTHHTSNDNLIGQVLFDTLPNLPLKFKTTLINNLKSKNNNHCEQKFTRPDGTSIWYSWKLDFLGKKDGAIDGITLILNDCSHRLGYDELLNEAQEVSRTGGWQVNLVNFEVLWTDMVNVIHEEPLEYVPLNFEACFAHFIEGEHRDKMYALVEQAVENGTSWDAEIQIKTGKGNIMWVRSKGKPSFVNGKCVRLFGICQDIHERKTLEIKHLEEVERLKKATESSKVGIWEYTFNTQKAIWDDVCFDIFDLDREACEDVKECWKSRVHPLDKKKIYAKLEGYTKGEGSGILENRIIVGDGSIRHVRSIINYVNDSDHNFVKTIGIMMDVTKEKQAEEKLREFASITSEQNNSLMNFAHMVSHDLRSHATNLSLATSYFFEEKNPDEKAKLKTMLKGATNNLLKTLDKLNEVVQSNAAIKEKLTPLNLLETIQNMKQNIHVLFPQQLVNFTIDVPNSYNVMAIPAYLESIFLNLCSNSLKYAAPNRSPEIEITSITEGDITKVLYRDNGRGIDMQKHGSQIFGMHKTFHKNKDANGVGLYITKNQIEAMGGAITLESEVNVGTTFYLEFNSAQNL